MLPVVDPYTVLQISDIEGIPVGESLTWRPVRRTLGVEAFGVNAYTAENAGDEIVEDHDETGSGAGGHQELYVVIAGRATFTVDGKEFDAPAGTLVFLRDPKVRRAAVAAEPNSTVLAVGGEPGEAYEVSPWEYYFAAIPAAKAGDWDRAVEITAAGLEDNQDSASFLYNLACFEAQAGRTEDAIEHITRAVELDPKKIGEWAATDTDLDPIRSDPRFPA
jgi:tetratricopeptide (TPR) repeat protein